MRGILRSINQSDAVELLFTRLLEFTIYINETIISGDSDTKLLRGEFLYDGDYRFCEVQLRVSHGHLCRRIEGCNISSNENTQRIRERDVGLAVYGELGILRDPVYGTCANAIAPSLLFDCEGLALGGQDFAVEKSAVFVDSFALRVLAETGIVSVRAEHTDAADLLFNAREECVPENLGVS